MSERLKKEAIVSDIKNNFYNSSIIFFYDYSDIVNEDIFKLKKELKKIKVKWKVYKNSLVERALENYEIQLKKNNAAVFCSGENDNHLGSLKILYEFNKKFDGIKRINISVDRDTGLINIETLDNWVKIPERNTLMNMLCYYLKLQILRLINILKKISDIEKAKS